MALDRDRILSFAGVFTPREVHVPAWADESGDDLVFVRSMTLAELNINSARAARNQVSADEKPDDKSLAAVIARCVIDQSGRRVFTDADTPAIGQLPAPQAMKLYEAITEESGETEESEKAIEGNSDAAPSGDSSSD